MSVINFDGKRFPSGWTFDRDKFGITSAVIDSGHSYSFRFPPDVPHSGQGNASFSITAGAGGDTLTVRYNVSSEAGSDLFRIFRDGVQVFSDSGTTGGWEVANISLTAGTHTIQLRYSKDNSVSSGLDTCFISSLSAPNSTFVGGTQPYQRVITFEGGVIPSDFTYDAAGASIVSDADTVGGLTKAHRFRVIGASQNTYVDIPISFSNGVGELAIRYRVSTESADIFAYLISGTQWWQDSGNPLVYRTAPTEEIWLLRAGTYTLRLRYTKDSNTDVGSDTVFISTLTIPTDTPPGALTSVAPASGSTAGGTAVTLTGTGFTGATGVLFGATAATSVVVVNDTTITCNTPAHAGGVVSVTAQRPSGDLTLVNAFTYTAPAVITSVAPNTGNVAGGTNVTITGTGFTGTTGVLFGASAGTSFTVVNDTTITVTTPAHASGAVTVTVQKPTGDATSANAFTYYHRRKRRTQNIIMTRAY